MVKSFFCLQFLIISIFTVEAYSADYDYRLFSACVNGCRGSSESYSKLSKSEQENVDKIIKVCIQTCMETAKEKKTTTKIERIKKEEDKIEIEQTNAPKTIIGNKLVYDIGIGITTPVNKYAYTGPIDIAYGSNGGAGFFSFGIDAGEHYVGIELFAAALSSYTTDYDSLSIKSHTKATVFYFAYKKTIEHKYNTYLKIGMGQGKTKLYADFKESGISYNSESHSTTDFSWYFAIGNSFTDENSSKKLGAEFRISSLAYKDNATDIGDLHWNTHPYILFSTMIWIKF